METTQIKDERELTSLDPEIRTNPWTGEVVIVAPVRGNRPQTLELAPPPSQQTDPDCPFCSGNERFTPEAVISLDVHGNPASPSNGGSTNEWEVRIIPNKYPAVSNTLSPAGSAEERIAPAYGYHDVVIESPKHLGRAGEIKVQSVAVSLQAIGQRVSQLCTDPNIRHVQVFKNCGAAAGASIYHTHSQIVALPVLPPLVEAARQQEERAFEQSGNSLWNQIAGSLDTGELHEFLIQATEQLLVFCPPFGRNPYEIWIGPKPDLRSPWNNAELRQELAAALLYWAQRIEGLAEGIAWNWLLHDSTANAAGHWHFELFPRMTSFAGFEWATGMNINPVDPQVAASVFRIPE